MNNFILEITVKANTPQTILCHKLIRSIHNRRRVYEGLWSEKAVVVKIFCTFLQAKRQMKREWEALQLLQKNGLMCPEVLFCGKTSEKNWAIVTKKIPESKVIFELLQSKGDSGTQQKLLKDVFVYLGCMHNRGVIQKDLHAGNFLVSRGKIYALDPAKMSFSDGEAPQKQSLKQLAILITSLPPQFRTTAHLLLESYFQQRNWELNDMVKKQLAGYVTKQTIRSNKKALRKSLRDSKNYIQLKFDNFYGIFRRDFAKGRQKDDFVRKIDSLMESGIILKRGNTCFVSRLKLADRNIVIKRYNHKGYIHSLRHTIKNSRAKKNWLNAHNLLQLGIKTPLPLAFIEVRKLGLFWKGYIVTEYCSGRKLCDFLKDKISADEQQAIKLQFIELLDKLKTNRIAHGDMKQSNILICDNKLVLIDLDSMKRYRNKQLFQLRYAKDLKSFKNLKLK